MPGKSDGAARQAREGVGVSSGDSSSPVPRPALNPDNPTLPGVESPPAAIGNLTSPADPAPQSSDSSEAETIVSPARSDPPSAGSVNHPIFAHIGATIFHEGDILGGRYEILKLLGMGGMGAVYKARDMEVERVVGLKVIRPDLAGNPAILARFKQELVLARQITHKNIVRIYDLNEADGVKFITMEFIEGDDLRAILTRHGKLSPHEAVAIILQVCAGLQAAHSEGVIHRDLKPGNIMQDGAGRVVIMDFGLARSLQGDGMTQTGMMLGTVEYMSPEQAMGKELDARSDEFAIGLIFYELLTGSMPYQAESAIASLVRRTQECVVPLVDVDASIPAELSDIVCRCLERDAQARFASVEELAEALEVWQGKRPRTGAPAPTRHAGAKIVAAPGPQRLPLKWIGIAVAAVVLAAGAAAGYRYWKGPAGGNAALQGPVVSLAIVPLYNASGDPSLNSMGAIIADTLSSDIGQSAHLRLVSADRLQQVLQDLRVSSQSQLDLSTLKRIAEFTHADTIVSGQYERFGQQTQITVMVHDLKNDREIPLKIEVPNDNQLLGSLETLAGNLREKLAASPQILKELEAHSQHVTTKSIPALRAYDEGLQLARAGNETQAVSKFEEATSQDPGFAMAFSKLAQTYAALGYDDKADQASRRAVELSDNLPAADKFLIEANHASILHDTAKAIAAYEELAKVNPDDTDVQFELAKLYEESNNFAEAKKYLTNVLASDPKNVAALLASGRVDIKSGDAQSALDPLNSALSLTIQFNNREQKANVLQALGIAYQRLNRPEDALHNFNDALAIRKTVGDQRGVAMSLLQLGQVQEALGNPKAALASYQEGVEVDRKIGDKNGLIQNLTSLAVLYLDHAKYDQAQQYANEALQLARDSHNESAQAMLLLDIGNAHFLKGEYQDALTYFQQSNDISEQLKLPEKSALALHALGLTNFSLGQYDTAISQYLKALDACRASGDKSLLAATSLDLGTLFATQGRYDAALKAQKEALDTFQQLNDKSYLMVWALGSYGDTLAAAGQEDEGRKYIEQALQLAPQANNDQATAAALNFLGDSYFYAGDYATARQQYDKALQLATKQKVPDQVVQAKLGIAKLDVIQGRQDAAIAALKKLGQDADAVGLKAQSVDASVYLGQALLAANRAAAARTELDNAVGRAEKLGLRVEQGLAQYFLGKSLAAEGKTAEAVPHYRETVRILESISKEDGVSRVLERSDLKDVYQNAMKSYQGGA